MNKNDRIDFQIQNLNHSSPIHILSTYLKNIQKTTTSNNHNHNFTTINKEIQKLLKNWKKTINLQHEKDKRFVIRDDIKILYIFINHIYHHVAKIFDLKKESGGYREMKKKVKKILEVDEKVYDRVSIYYMIEKMSNDNDDDDDLGDYKMVSELMKRINVKDYVSSVYINELEKCMFEKMIKEQSESEKELTVDMFKGMMECLEMSGIKKDGFMEKVIKKKKENIELIVNIEKGNLNEEDFDHIKIFLRVISEEMDKSKKYDGYQEKFTKMFVDLFSKKVKWFEKMLQVYPLENKHLSILADILEKLLPIERREKLEDVLEMRDKFKELITNLLKGPVQSYYSALVSRKFLSEKYEKQGKLLFSDIPKSVIESLLLPFETIKKLVINFKFKMGEDSFFIIYISNILFKVLLEYIDAIEKSIGEEKDQYSPKTVILYNNMSIVLKMLDDDTKSIIIDENHVISQSEKDGFIRGKDYMIVYRRNIVYSNIVPFILKEFDSQFKQFLSSKTVVKQDGLSFFNPMIDMFKNKLKTIFIEDIYIEIIEETMKMLVQRYKTHFYNLKKGSDLKMFSDKFAVFISLTYEVGINLKNRIDLEEIQNWCLYFNQGNLNLLKEKTDLFILKILYVRGSLNGDLLQEYKKRILSMNESKKEEKKKKKRGNFRSFLCSVKNKAKNRMNIVSKSSQQSILRSKEKRVSRKMKTMKRMTISELSSISLKKWERQDIQTWLFSISFKDSNLKESLGMKIKHLGGFDLFFCAKNDLEIVLKDIKNEELLKFFFSELQKLKDRSLEEE